MLRQVEEDERRELPDRFLRRARLAQAAAGKAAADGKGERDEFAGEHATGHRCEQDSRQADHQADQRARVRAGDQPGEQRALERQVGSVVVQLHAERHARGERHAEREREHQPVDPAAALEDQDVPETVVPASIVARTAMTASLTKSGEQELLGREILRHKGHCRRPTGPARPNVMIDP